MIDPMGARSRLALVVALGVTPVACSEVFPLDGLSGAAAGPDAGTVDGSAVDGATPEGAASGLDGNPPPDGQAETAPLDGPTQPAPEAGANEAGTPTYAEEVMSDHPAAYWRFDEATNALDREGLLGQRRERDVLRQHGPRREGRDRRRPGHGGHLRRGDDLRRHGSGLPVRGDDGRHVRGVGAAGARRELPRHPLAQRLERPADRGVSHVRRADEQPALRLRAPRPLVQGDRRVAHAHQRRARGLTSSRRSTAPPSRST